MLIPNFHKSVIVINSIETRFYSNFFQVVCETRSTRFHSPLARDVIPDKTLLLVYFALPLLNWTSKLTTNTFPSPKSITPLRRIVLNVYLLNFCSAVSC